MADYQPVLLRNVGNPEARSVAGYEAVGGYQALRKALEMEPQAIINEVKLAELRGRGGAGFPAGVKWGFLPADRETTYLCVNADESEPPTFSNRVLMENDPHQLIEGTLIASIANRVRVAYIYIRVEFHEGFHILQAAIDDAYESGYLGTNILGSGHDVDIFVHRGAGAYVCGEETGLLESLEGKRGWPRIKPPFPAVEGLFRKPTIVNNVETLCNVPHIIERGADWFRGLGSEGSFGPKLFCVSGPVKRPGCYEGLMDISVRELIEGDEFGQGMRDRKSVKGVFPGGISMGILSAEELDCKLDFNDPRKYGLLGLGTAAAAVINEDVSMLQVLRNITRFFSHESCGQCTHCREGTTWAYKIADRICRGEGRTSDLDLLIELGNNMGMMPGMNICGLSDGAAWPIRTIVEKFRPEFEAAVQKSVSLPVGAEAEAQVAGSA
jgi:NADH-quinone oxidoreductase subunit F